MEPDKLLMDQVVAINATYLAAGHQGRLGLASELNDIIQSEPDVIVCLTKICHKLKSVITEGQNA